MNYFAHLFFSEPTLESRVGHLLGDFSRGVDRATLDPEMARALAQHHWIDRFTDSHPEVQCARELFSRQRRRFSGVALDVLFDHFLLNDWALYAWSDQDLYIDTLYRDLLEARPLMPLSMKKVTARVVGEDWFRAYRSLETVNFALDRIAARIRFPNKFAGVGREIEQHYEQLHGHFKAFFPELLSSYRNVWQYNVTKT
ncbi:ACP phosphodiesterase [Marinobacteraceae bacterium S3BR75-40.1]